MRRSVGGSTDQSLASALPGWVETATRLWFLDRAGTDEKELVRLVAGRWDAGSLHHEDGVWWCEDAIARAAGPSVRAPDQTLGAPSATPGASVFAEMRDLCDQGRPDDALALATATLVPASGVNDLLDTDPELVAIVGLGSCFALVEAGRLHAAAITGQTGRMMGAVGRSTLLQGWYGAALGICEIGMGRLDDALASLAEAKLLGRLCGDPQLRAFSAASFELAHAMVGRQPPRHDGPGTVAQFAIEHGAVLADSWLVSMHRSRTLAWKTPTPLHVAALLEQAEAARGAGRFGVAASLAGEVALLGDPAGATRVFRRFGELQGEILPLWPDISAALSDGDAVARDLLADRLDQLGVAGLSASLTLQAAAVHHRAGDEQAVRESLKAANRRAAAVQSGSAYLAQFRALLPLREREREIAELAAAGNSNKAIADELVISVRTVENHLYRVYDKLGVAGREDLAPLLGSLPSSPEK